MSGLRDIGIKNRNIDIGVIPEIYSGLWPYISGISDEHQAVEISSAILHYGTFFEATNPGKNPIGYLIQWKRAHYHTQRQISEDLFTDHEDYLISEVIERDKSLSLLARSAFPKDRELVDIMRNYYNILSKGGSDEYLCRALQEFRPTEEPDEISRVVNLYSSSATFKKYVEYRLRLLNLETSEDLDEQDFMSELQDTRT